MKMVVKDLKDIANILRRDVLKMTTTAGSGHPTSCFSIAEIMSVLFFNEMSYDTQNSSNPNNDEFILSKGHAAPILYSSFYRAGLIKSNLMNLRKLNSNLEGHPMPRSLKWIKVATGSLGQGLSVGVGMALAAKLQNRNFKTYVLMGDSEVAEGSVYEAMELASYYKLNNLVAIVDVNRLGQRGETMLGHDMKAYKKRFEGFGWNVFSIDGHNIKQIIGSLKKSKKSKKPTIIIAKTLKGKGVSFLQNKEGWHGRALNKEELEKALKEIPNPKIPNVKIGKPKSSGKKTLKSKKIKTKCIHFTSIGGDSFKTQKRLVDYAIKNDIKISFNPSNYQIEKENLTKIIKNAHVLSVNQEEAKLLVKNKSSGKNLFNRLHKMGPKIVCITNGKNGGGVYDGKKLYEYKPHNINVCECTGAGDAFVSSFVAGLIKFNDIEKAIKLAIVNSESVIQKMGAQSGLLNFKEATNLIKKLNFNIKKHVI